MSDTTCLQVTKSCFQPTNTSDFTSQTHVQFTKAVGQWQTKEIFHSQYTMHSHALGTGFRICVQEGLSGESKSDIRARYGQRQQ